MIMLDAVNAGAGRRGPAPMEARHIRSLAFNLGMVVGMNKRG